MYAKDRSSTFLPSSVIMDNNIIWNQHVNPGMHNLKTKSRNNLKILGARRMRRMFHMEDPQILGATLENLVSTVTW